MNKIMNQTKATTAQLEATAPPLTTKKVPRVIIEMGYKDLMPFHFWLDCFEFNNLRNTYERLYAIEKACLAHTRCANVLTFGSKWGPPVAWDIGLRLVQHWADIYDKAFFEREVLGVELENHNYLHVRPWLLDPIDKGIFGREHPYGSFETIAARRTQMKVQCRL